MEPEKDNAEQSPLETAATTPVEDSTTTDPAVTPDAPADDAAVPHSEPDAAVPADTATGQPATTDAPAEDPGTSDSAATASDDAGVADTPAREIPVAEIPEAEQPAESIEDEIALDVEDAAGDAAESARNTDEQAALRADGPEQTTQAGEGTGSAEASDEQTDTSEQTDAQTVQAEESANDQPSTQENFGAFGPGASLMFHAPDPDEIRRAAEEQAARLREAAKERDAQREAERAARKDVNSEDDVDSEDDKSGEVTSKRRRRRRRGDEDMELVDESDGSVTRVRAPRGAGEGTGSDEVTGVKGSTRLEAKRQRRRESRQFGRRRHVITEAEFLARRESVERKMLVRQKDDRIQIGVLEDGILAEHFVSHTQQDSLIGNVYVGKVQNVLPSMEAAFVDIGRGRNAVLYAGEVDWDAAELGSKPRKIENALKSGDTVLVQVTKDPVGHKGARLTSQVSLPGRYLVYVPGGSMTGISRKLPDVERQRLKKILKDRLPEGAGVIVRTAAEGASETELTNDINRLRSQWEQIQDKAKSTKTLAPEMLYAEPDLTIKTVRDVFNEDFTAMVVQGEQAWDNIEAYVTYVAPDLLDRLERWTGDDDLFEHMRVEEQIQKALERKVFLPSGGSLVIDRTEAMTVVDVNTGKFTGSGGNLEETVTKNNLEAAEEIVRQLRLRDIGGIIVVDFIDMVLESNRDLVLRRLVECLGRDRTKHQVAEVTSLGLVQMTRKRMGTGLLEVFSEPCEECAGRGVVVHDHPLKGRSGAAPSDHRGTRHERKRSRNKQHNGAQDKPRNGNQHHSSDEPDQARVEATRTAFANIAAASSHDESDDAARNASQGTAPQSGGGQAEDTGSQEQQTSRGQQGGEHASENSHGESEGGRRRRKRRGKRSRGRGQQGEDNAVQNDGSGRDGSGNDSRGDSRSEDRSGGDSSASLTIHGEVIELPHGQSEQRGSEGTQEALSLDSLSAAFTDAGEHETSTEGAVQDADAAPQPREAVSKRSAAGHAPSNSGTAQSSAGQTSAAQQQTSGAASSAGGNRPAEAPAAPARRRRGSRRAVAPAAAPGTASVETHEYTQERQVSRFTAEAGAVAPAASGDQPTIVGVGIKAQDITMTGKQD
ncbi:Rne/Rng family ribonuclease [Kocuria sp. KD4]|uniref:Rne/Rng family ribonuclease n=1 Tax=Kocuria sp. KD4 TaxID=2719588 RepID=UPI0014279DC0|nr:Rne/Rng family ribonuclease [Kocuria sp. KD4]QIR69645.1 Rne/Rng family ribonuclease [Kocuria sp. KD4]